MKFMLTLSICLNICVQVHTSIIFHIDGNFEKRSSGIWCCKIFDYNKCASGFVDGDVMLALKSHGVRGGINWEKIIVILMSEQML